MGIKYCCFKASSGWGSSSLMVENIRYCARGTHHNTSWIRH
uniref:Uncharacterized protein n=1 Tax=Rhizophora mucronata TaxID=61149 RepID=A0A2P2IML2_RHIMU